MENNMVWEKVKVQEIDEDLESKGDYTSRDNVFHASELAYNCMYKAYRDRTEGKEFNDAGKYALWRGRVFDQYITKLFDENELRVTQRVPNTPFTIRGRIDGVDYENNILYEVKSVASIKYIRDQPYAHHIPQGLFYLNNYDPLATLRFLYVSMDGYVSLEYVPDPSEMRAHNDEYNRKAKELGLALKHGEPPEPVKCAECKWCNYKKDKTCPLTPKRRSRK
jgi:hypothetical protein